MIESEDGDLAIRHTPSCPRQADTACNKRCHLNCRHGSSTSLYCRSFLQGRLVQCQSKDLCKQQLYTVLKASAKMLDEIVANSNLPDTPTLDLGPRDFLTTSNPLLANKTEIFICDAVLMYLDNPTPFGDMKLLRRIAKADAANLTFWILNAACCHGNEWLVDYILAPPTTTKLLVDPQEITSLVSDCLFTAIKGGHSRVIEKFLDKLEHSDQVCDHFRCPIWAAFDVGNAPVAERVARMYTESELENCCVCTVISGRWDLSREDSQCAIFRWVWPRARGRIWMADSSVATHVSKAGSIKAFEFLLHYGRLDMCDIEPGGIPNALHAPAVHGHVKFLTYLLDNRYLAEVPHKRQKECLEAAAVLALITNHLNVFLELKFKRPEFGLGDIFVHLAAADGTIDMMKEHMNNDAGVLEAAASNHSVQINAGQEALELAMRCLKPQNVEYLLGLGVRLHDPIVGIEWTCYSVRKAAFDATQKVLREFFVPELQLTV